MYTLLANFAIINLKKSSKQPLLLFGAVHVLL